MREEVNPTASAGGVQVFELTMDNPEDQGELNSNLKWGEHQRATMDNPEDQDELNRWLHKPGEPGPYPPPKIGSTGHGESTAESIGKKKGEREGIVEGEEFYGHQEHPTEPSGNGPEKDTA